MTAEELIAALSAIPGNYEVYIEPPDADSDFFVNAVKFNRKKAQVFIETAEWPATRKIAIGHKARKRGLKMGMEYSNLKRSIENNRGGLTQPETKDLALLLIDELDGETLDELLEEIENNV